MNGYLTDIGYTYGYYRELEPMRARLALLGAGFHAPTIGTACELGFGQGVTLNLQAASSSATTWYGTDFNPAHAAFARDLAGPAGGRAHLFDDAFASFCARTDLPDFDFIALHGIWSWISDGDRAVIVDFVRRKLAVGGVLYISYNTYPGWSASAPLRHLMSQHALRATGRGTGAPTRVESALGFLEKMFDTKPAWAAANPQVVERFKQIKEQNRAYVAHEYLNRDWCPMYFADVAEWLEPGKVSFACSAHLLDQIDSINLATEQKNLLSGMEDGQLRQTVKDFMVNQQFRRDYWVKGLRPLGARRQAELLRLHRVTLVTPPQDVPLHVQGARGRANLSEAIYRPILDALADHRGRTIADIEATVSGKGVSFAQLIQALLVLAGMGHVTSVQDEAVVESSLSTSMEMNRAVMEQAKSSGDIGHLACPVTGGAIAATRIQQLFALALLEGRQQPSDWAAFVWQLLSAQGQAVLKDGKVVEGAEANLAELNRQAKVFADKDLPLLKALQVL